MSDPEPATATDRSEVRVQFWSLVLTFKVAILGLAIGPMVLYFTDRTLLGAAMVATGAVMAVRGYRRYWHIRYD